MEISQQQSLEVKRYRKTNQSVIDRIGDDWASMVKKIDVILLDFIYKKGVVPLIENRTVVLSEFYRDEKEQNAEIYKYLKGLARNKDHFHFYLDSLKKECSPVLEQRKKELLELKNKIKEQVRILCENYNLPLEDVIESVSNGIDKSARFARYEKSQRPSNNSLPFLREVDKAQQMAKALPMAVEELRREKEGVSKYRSLFLQNP